MPRIRLKFARCVAPSWVHRVSEINISQLCSEARQTRCHFIDVLVPRSTVDLRPSAPIFSVRSGCLAAAMSPKAVLFAAAITLGPILWCSSTSKAHFLLIDGAGPSSLSSPEQTSSIVDRRQAPLDGQSALKYYAFHCHGS